MSEDRQLEAFIAQHKEAAKRIITPATFRRFLELTIPPSVRGPSRRSLPSFKYSGLGGLTEREKRLAAGIEEPVNWEVLEELVAGVRADEDEYVARHQAEMKRRRAEQEARAYSDRLIASIEAERAARSTLPSFAAGGTFGFTPQEVEGFGFPASVAASPTLAPAASPIASAAPAPTPAPPPASASPAPAASATPSANSGFTPQQLTGFGFPAVAAAQPTTTRPAASGSATASGQNNGFTPQQLTGFGFPAAPTTQPTPTRPATSVPAAASGQSAGFTQQQVTGFGFPPSAAAPQRTPAPKPAAPASSTSSQNNGFTPKQVAGFGFPPAQPGSPSQAGSAQQQGFTPQQVAGFARDPAAFSPEVIDEVMGLTPGQEQAFLGGQAPFDQSVLDSTLGLTPEQEAAFLGGQAPFDQGVVNAALGLTPAQEQAFLGGSELVDQDALAGALAGFNVIETAGFTSPQAAHSQAALDAALGVTVADEVGFSGGELAVRSQEDILAAMAAQQQFNQDFGPLVEQEVLETQSRQLEGGRLAGRQEQLKQFEREFAEADPNHPTSFAPQDPRLERFREEFFHKESLETDPNLPSSFAPLIPGTHEEYRRQGIEAIKRRWEGFANLAESPDLDPSFEDIPENKRAEGPQFDVKSNTIFYDETPFLQGDHELSGQALGADSAIDGVPAHELTHGVREWLKANKPNELELLEHGESGEFGPKIEVIDETGRKHECPVGGVAELACHDLVARVQSIYSYLMRVSAEFENRLQIIVADNDIPARARSNLAGIFGDGPPCSWGEIISGYGQPQCTNLG